VGARGSGDEVAAANWIWRGRGRAEVAAAGMSGAAGALGTSRGAGAGTSGRGGMDPMGLTGAGAGRLGKRTVR
jgi:hypothetical protein